MEKWSKICMENKKLIIEWLCIFILIITLFTISQARTYYETWHSIVSWNLHWELSGTWYGLLMIYWIELMLLIFIWDLLWHRLSILVHTFCDKLSYLWVKKKLRLVKLIRIKYGFNKLHYYSRIAFTFGSNGRDHSKLINYLVRSTPTDLLKFVISLILGKTSIIAGVLTLITVQNITFRNIENSVPELWNVTKSFLWDNLSKLSAVVVVVLIVFIGYFINRRGIIRRSVAQANRKKLEEIVEIHRSISHYTVQIILKGSRNIDYAIDCYDLLVECWAYKNNITTNKISKQKNWPRRFFRDVEDFNFEDISELGHFIDEIDKMKSADNKELSRWFSRYNYELLSMSMIHLFGDVDRMDRLLFTKKGVEELFRIPKKHSRNIAIFDGFDDGTVEENLNNFDISQLKDSIIKGTELLYKLSRYVQTLEGLLHIESDKLGRGVRLFTKAE